jgi:hypothetical protein
MVLIPARFVSAEEASEAAQTENEATNESSTIDTIKKVIQEKKVELGSGTARLRSNRAYLAKVVRVSEETLTVSNYAGNKIIPLEKDVTQLEKLGKTIAVDQIAVDDWVGVQGEIVDDNLKIKKVMVYDKDFTPKDKMIVVGSISSLGKNDLKVQPRSGDEAVSLSFDKNTKFQDMTGNEATVSDFYEDLQCLLVAFADKNGNYVVSTIRALTSFDDN